MKPTPAEPSPSANETVDSTQTAEMTLIGWRELVDLPRWNIRAIRAKADTGARSSAVDVSHLEELPDGRVRFELMVRRGAQDERQVIEAEIVRRARVKSSLGRVHDRLFVEATMRFAGRTIQTQLGLVNREGMISRMLLGRRSLEGQFLVDPGCCYLHGRRTKSRKSKKDLQP